MRCKEVHLLAMLLVTFVIVWAGLVTRMPEQKETDVKFEDAYRRFTSEGNGRTLLGSENPPIDIPEQQNGAGKTVLEPPIVLDKDAPVGNTPVRTTDSPLPTDVTTKAETTSLISTSTTTDDVLTKRNKVKEVGL